MAGLEEEAMTECRTCEYCGAVTTAQRRHRCSICLLLVCPGCYREDDKSCVACFTLLDRKLAESE